MNRSINNAANLEIVHGAIAERSGEIAFTLEGHVDDGFSKSGRVSVAAYSIDDLSRRFGFPDVLFIDVEGYELHALRGAGETLRHFPDCFVEVHVGVGLERYGGTADQIIRFFPTDRYLCLVRSANSSEFTKLAESQEVLKERFFLLALARIV